MPEFCHKNIYDQLVRVDVIDSKTMYLGDY